MAAGSGAVADRFVDYRDGMQRTVVRIEHRLTRNEMVAVLVEGAILSGLKIEDAEAKPWGAVRVLEAVRHQLRLHGTSPDSGMLQMVPIKHRNRWLVWGNTQVSRHWPIPGLDTAQRTLKDEDCPSCQWPERVTYWRLNKERTSQTPIALGCVKCDYVEEVHLVRAGQQAG